MSNEQKACLSLLFLEEALEIKCCYNRLSRPGRRHHQIAPVSVDQTLGFQSIENSFLKGMRAKVEKYRGNGLSRPCMSDGLPEYKRFFRVKGNKLVTVPVGFELREELVQNVRHILRRYFEIPFQPACHRCLRHVRRTDVGSRKPTFSTKMIRLGVEPCPLGIVGDANSDV